MRRDLPGGEAFRAQMLTLESSQAQQQAVAGFFDTLGAASDRLPGHTGAARSGAAPALMDNEP